VCYKTKTLNFHQQKKTSLNEINKIIEINLVLTQAQTIFTMSISETLPILSKNEDVDRSHKKKENHVCATCSRPSDKCTVEIANKTSQKWISCDKCSEWLHGISQGL